MKEYEVRYSLSEKKFRGPGVFEWRNFPEGSEKVKTAFYSAESPEAAIDMLKADFGMFRVEIAGSPTECQPERCQLVMA